MTKRYYHPGQETSIDVTAAFLQTTMNARGLKAVVSPLFDGPQVQAFRVDLAVGVRPEQVERIDGALAIAAGTDRCRISRQRGYLMIEAPKPPEDRQTLKAERLLTFNPGSFWKIPLGIDVRGKILWFDLTDERTCHAVIGGTTGSGKSNLLHWMLFRLMNQNPAGRLQLLLMDPKGFELRPFSRCRHLLHPPESSPDKIVQLLIWIQAEMRRRSENHTHQPRILAVIDEVKELAGYDPRVKAILASIAQLGRGLGIHLITSTQQPGAKALGEAVVNFPARLLGRVASATLAYGAAGRAKSQANELLGRGDFLLLTSDGSIRFQAPLMDEALIERLPTTNRVPEIDLGGTLDLTPVTASDKRGGHNRKPLDLEQVREMVLEQGMTAGQLHHALGIYYERAQRLTVVARAVEQGANATEISFKLDIPPRRARELVEVFGNGGAHGA
jgi:S-DNA-T family DNA segregation ATPase FtsK/SpoIIIE